MLGNFTGTHFEELSALGQFQKRLKEEFAGFDSVFAPALSVGSGEVGSIEAGWQFGHGSSYVSLRNYCSINQKGRPSFFQGKLLNQSG